MAELMFHAPEEAAMERLLSEHPDDLKGVILSLAWQQGLSREEIITLKWEQVDLDAELLRLPDREVPLFPETVGILTAWRERCAPPPEYVAVTLRLRKPIAPQSASRLAREALDSAGQREVRLLDLRYDFIRRQLRTHEWPWVLRVAGVSVNAYRAKLIALAQSDEPVPDCQTVGRADPGAPQTEAERVQTILEGDRTSPAGIALWLTTSAGLRCEEIVRLTWAEVDLYQNALLLPDRRVELPTPLRWVLSDEKARRGPEEDPHVILTPRSRRPMAAARLNTLVRDKLIRGGVEQGSLGQFRRDLQGEEERRTLLEYAETHGSLSRREAAALLNVSDGMAYRRLLALSESGDLVRINLKYYPAATAVPPEKQMETIQAHIAAHGPASRETVAELLHIGVRHAGRILQRMTQAGDLALLKPSRTYALGTANG